MNVYEAPGGGGLIVFAIAGFGIGYVLTKLKIINDGNVTKFATWSSCAFAAVVAFFSGGDNAGPMASLVGKLAVFGIVWFVCGLIFTVGLAFGVEKANKSGKTGS
ncbi:hypothetical protein [Caballeronia sp. dw_276]|uniref:hypothetical protein n=1 Tax=Caballeronia sp. dw_276 TaxID=2719795 RepID=UPI001BD2EB25|nr:hypothetical protein [Caballeronia sp. dw_276]